MSLGAIAISLGRLVGVRGVVGIAAGLSLMAAWNHAPWGLAGRLEAATSARQQAAIALARAGGALTTAASEIRARDQTLKTNGKSEAIDATATATFWKGQCRAAYDAGYASRRCDGSVDDAGGVRRDVRALWSAGAYPGRAAGVSGQPGG